MSSFLVENDSIIKFDFNEMSYSSFKSDSAKLNIDNKFPTFIVDEKIFYIWNRWFKNLTNKFKLIRSICFSNINISNSFKKRDNSIDNILIGLFGVILFWIILKLFLYKDHIKALLLFDEKAIYFKNNSVEITLKEKSL